MNPLPEIPDDIAQAAARISHWMAEQGHTKWQMFDLCSRNHADMLLHAEGKLATLSRLIELAQQCDDAKSEAELAASATFMEALALTNADVLEKERDEARAKLAVVSFEKQSALQSAKDNAKNFRTAEVMRLTAERERDQAREELRKAQIPRPDNDLIHAERERDQLREQNRNLLLQQAHEESVRADLQKRLEYLSIEVSFANKKKDDWSLAASLCASALRDCMGHLPGEHPHWQQACKANDIVRKLVLETDKKA